MATLRDPLATERPIARLGGSARAQPMDPGVSDAAGRGLEMIGQAIGSGAEEMYRAQLVEEDKINTLAAEDAFTKLRNQQLELTNGETQGFARQKGAAAVTRPLFKEWNKRFDDAETLVASTLTNDNQRLKFKQRAQVARLQYQEDMLRHVGQESDVYAKEVYDGTVAVEQRNAVARWDSPNDLALSLGRVKDAVEQRAERYGWAAEYKDGVLLQEQGRIHSAVVQQAIAAGNYQYAEEWYNQHRSDIDLQTAKMLEIAVRDGTQKQLYADYTADFLANRDSLQGLRALEETVLKDATLDPTRQNVLSGRIMARQDLLERRVQAASAAAERQLEKAISTVNSNTLAGFEPSPEQLAPILNASKGTLLEAEAQRMVNLANATRQFRLASPMQQSQYLAEIEAEARKDPTRFDIQTLTALRSIHDNQKRQLEADPVTFAVRQGYVDPKPLDLSKPGEQAEGLQERFALSRSLRETHQAPMKPLTTEEAALLSSVLKKATVEEKRQYFADLSTASGDDVEGYSAVMSQLAPDDPVTAVAGVYAGKKRTMAADLMLRGQALLQPTRSADGQPDKGKLWPMPPEKEMRDAFASYERDAFAGRPELRNAFEQSTKAIYAARSAEAGDSTGVFDSDRWDEAVELATGGIAKYNGKGLVLPYRYGIDEFEDAVERRIDQIMVRSDGPTTKEARDRLEASMTPEERSKVEYHPGRLAPSVTADKLRDMPLEPIGDGRYVFRAGDGVLVDMNNRPVILDFNVQEEPEAKTDFVPEFVLQDIGATP